MATHDDVRRIASNLPGAIESTANEQFGFSVMVKGKAKGFVWTWMERVQPKKPRVPNPGVLAIVVRNLDIKEMIVSSLGRASVEDPHYHGYPAVLVRLDAIAAEELEDLIIEAWRCKAPANAVKQYDALTGPTHP